MRLKLSSHPRENVLPGSREPLGLNAFCGKVDSQTGNVWNEKRTKHSAEVVWIFYLKFSMIPVEKAAAVKKGMELFDLFWQNSETEN